MRIIAGMMRGRTFEAPKGMDTRPTLDRVRESLFNILQRRVMDARVLDLFAGSGGLSFESLSRGAVWATLVDHDKAASKCQMQNIEKLKLKDKTQVLTCDWQRAVAMLQAEKKCFDLIFLDPPYAMNDLTEVTRALAPLLHPDGMVVVEHQAGKPSLVADGYLLQDERRYGYAGISFYVKGAT